jgi:hypothetical protein
MSRREPNVPCTLGALAGLFGLVPEARGKPWEQVRVVVVARNPADADSDAFRRGFERGSEYYRKLTAR